MMKRITAIFLTVVSVLGSAGQLSAQESYRIKPGDVLRIEVLEDTSINRNSLVLPDGRISVPLAGTVPAAGRTLSQIRTSVVEQLAPNFASGPTVFISIARLATPELELPTEEQGVETVSIYVLGEVTRPGKVEVLPGTTLLQFLAEIGGFSKFAATKRVQLRRVDKTGTERVYNVNYKDILAGKTSIGMTTLAAGDIVVVPERRLFE